MNQEEIKLKDLIKILIKRIKFILSITLVIGILSSIFDFYIAVPVYKSSARVFIGMDREDNRQYSMNDLKTYKEFIATYMEIIKTNDLVKKAIEAGNIDRSTKEILDNLDAEDITNTQIVQIIYKDKDPYLVKRVLESVSAEFIERSKELIPGGSAELIETIEVPDQPASPKKILNLIISVTLGFILGSILSICIENFEEKEASVEQIESASKLKVVGSIPKYKRCKGVF